MFNYRKIFDEVEAWLTRPDFTQAVADGCCSYRTGNGNRCAIGKLIPDADYDPAMEGKSITMLCMHGAFGPVMQRIFDFSKDPEEYTKERVFLNRLQRVHDRCNIDGVSVRTLLDEVKAQYATELNAVVAPSSTG